MRRITPKWSEEEIKNINDFQNLGHMHPFTCPGNPEVCKKPDQRELIATENGMVCACGAYKQDWVHQFMAEPQPQTNAFLQKRFPQLNQPGEQQEKAGEASQQDGREADI